MYCSVSQKDLNTTCVFIYGQGKKFAGATAMVVNIEVHDLEFYYKGVFSVLEFIFLLHL